MNNTFWKHINEQLFPDHTLCLEVIVKQRSRRSLEKCLMTHYTWGHCSNLRPKCKFTFIQEDGNKICFQSIGLKDWVLQRFLSIAHVFPQIVLIWLVQQSWLIKVIPKSWAYYTNSMGESPTTNGVCIQEANISIDF